MNNREENFKKSVGRIFSGFEPEPSEGVWGSIQSELKRRKRIVLFRRMAIAASLLILLGLGFSLKDSVWNTLQPADRQSIPQSIQEQDQNADNEEKIAGLSENQDNNPENQLKAASSLVDKRPEKQVKSKQINRQKFITAQSKTEINPVSVSIAENAENLSLLTPDNNISEGEIAKHEVDDDQFLQNIEPSQVNLPEKLIHLSPEQTNPIHNDYEKKWGIAMNYGVNPAIDLSQADLALNSEKSNYSLDASSSQLAEETSYFGEVEETSHKPPVSFGVLLSRQMAERWFVESGLVYTKLAYQVKTGEVNFTRRDYNTEIDCLGIPLGVRYTIAGKKRFGLFASQMLITEKGLEGSSVIETFSLGRLTDTETSGWKVRGIQISSLTALGGDVKLAGNLSFYSQVGVQVFFLNRSQPYTIRSARMAWPSFQAGFRMKLN